MYTLTLTRTRFERLSNWLYGRDAKLQAIAEFVSKLITNVGGYKFKEGGNCPSTDWLFIKAELVGQHPVYVSQGGLVTFPPVMMTWNDFLDLPDRVITEMLKEVDTLELMEVHPNEYHGTFKDYKKKALRMALSNHVSIDLVKEALDLPVGCDFPPMNVIRK